MAKSTKYAVPICIGLTILAIIGIVIGYLTKRPIFPIVFLLPTAIYEVFRTEGISTKAASWGLLLILILESILIIAKINFNVASFIGNQAKSINGYQIPLGDIKTVCPALMAILSIVLFTKTYGVYTKWMAVIIIITSVFTILLLDPAIVGTFFNNNSLGR